MFNYTYYLSSGYFPTNSRIILKESWLKMPPLDWWKKFKRPVTSLVGRGVATQAICFKVENRVNVSHMESSENKSEEGGAAAESQVSSTIFERKPQCVLLQTCDVEIRDDTNTSEIAIG
ncbi:hypothetical protein AVEN_111692-1 [Araneus ventricosus]|uniref:Uncharacterized protein n=1 Tax=Araneus ventricosus TaxID=182803 RepID=A0A4Y1ZVU2_ARAVE|nr:hypothetical protein AVEN_159567-1 [Araneus ventricosus]GBL69466.1 hypothetical protein AVEN_238565-1 [Araneus ventricosus]GBL69598.1 hypothetical protein AVEN_70313-1 [Araneus ventricosus]GBL69637.1 hypothetical protein AVEN_111692-1 [Araneus ventricosus]